MNKKEDLVNIIRASIFWLENKLETEIYIYRVEENMCIVATCDKSGDYFLETKEVLNNPDTDLHHKLIELDGVAWYLNTQDKAGKMRDIKIALDVKIEELKNADKPINKTDRTEELKKLVLRVLATSFEYLCDLENSRWYEVQMARLSINLYREECCFLKPGSYANINEFESIRKSLESIGSVDELTVGEALCVVGSLITVSEKRRDGLYRKSTA